MTRTVFLLMLLCCVTRANYSVTCNDSTENGLYFNRSDDGVEGRYVVKWCTVADKNVTHWNLNLQYVTPWKPERCDRTPRSSKSHSAFSEGVQLNLTCTHVCFSAELDLIFNATCYIIQTQQVIQGQKNTKTVRSNDSYFYITNEWPMGYFINSSARSVSQSDGEDIIFNWFLGHVPAMDYQVQLRKDDNQVGSLPTAPTGQTFQTREQLAVEPDSPIAMNCSSPAARPSLVSCRARAPFGCYGAELQHRAPWARAFFGAQSISKYYQHFCHLAPAPPPDVAVSHDLWWTVGGALVALLLALLLLLLALSQRARLADKLRARVRWEWLARLAGHRPHGAERARGRVLLLYARDCEHMRRAAELLQELLLLVTDCEVVDLYSAESVSAAAPAGGAWLRALLRRGDTRVLLLQSPALALYCTRVADGGGEPVLQAPLLGARVAWRAPHAADALLALALRLLADGAHLDPLPYKKYYVATVAGVRHVDVVPALTPQRRYLLPPAAELLLRDLAPVPEPAVAVPEPAVPGPEPARDALVRRLAAALDEFRRYALADPDYLSKDLIYD